MSNQEQIETTYSLSQLLGTIENKEEETETTIIYH